MKKINLKQLGQIRLVTVNKGDKAIKAICKFLGLNDNGYPIWLKVVTENGEDAIVRYPLAPVANNPYFLKSC